MLGFAFTKASNIISIQERVLTKQASKTNKIDRTILISLMGDWIRVLSSEVPFKIIGYLEALQMNSVEMNSVILAS